MIRNLSSSRRIQFSNSHFIRARVIAPALRAGCAFSLAPRCAREACLVRALDDEGMERREAQRWCFASRAMGKRVALRRSIGGDFWREDRSSGTGQARRALIRRDFSAFILSASSSR
jgi:hypothetical protein